MKVVINNLQRRVDIGHDLAGRLEKVAEYVRQLTVLGEDYEVSVALVSDADMQRLNSQYRGKDEPTDVLSFSMTDADETPDSSGSEMMVHDGDATLLGDVVISLETAVRQAEDYRHSLEREVAYLFVHGLLHLLGHDHEDGEARANMRRLEEAAMSAVGLSREG